MIDHLISRRLAQLQHERLMTLQRLDDLSRERAVALARGEDTSDLNQDIEVERHALKEISYA